MPNPEQPRPQVGTVERSPYELAAGDAPIALRTSIPNEAPRQKAPDASIEDKLTRLQMEAIELARAAARAKADYSDDGTAFIELRAQLMSVAQEMQWLNPRLADKETTAIVDDFIATAEFSLKPRE